MVVSLFLPVFGSVVELRKNVLLTLDDLKLKPRMPYTALILIPAPEAFMKLRYCFRQEAQVLSNPASGGA
jgi:hypothetical protein